MKRNAGRIPLLALVLAVLSAGGCSHHRYPELRPSGAPGLHRGSAGKAKAKGKRKGESRGKKKGHRKHRGAPEAV